MTRPTLGSTGTWLQVEGQIFPDVTTVIRTNLDDRMRRLGGDETTECVSLPDYDIHRLWVSASFRTKRTHVSTSLNHLPSPPHPPARFDSIAKALQGLDPITKSLLDLVAVLLHEEHVAVAVEAGLAELEVLRLAAAGLQQELDAAVVVGSVVGRLRGDEEDGLVGEVDELARGGGLSLEHALDVVLTLGRVGLLDEVGCGIGDLGGVGDGDVGETVGAGGLVAEDSLLEGRAGGLEQNEGLGQLGAGIGDDDGHEAALAVTENDGGSADLVEEGGTGGLDGCLLVGGIVDELNIGAVEGIKDLVTHHAGTGPLGVVHGLGPEHILLDGGEALLDDLGGVR